ncbi:MAG: signal transduction histidine kinase/CheY-like chemotaxis protein [Saprospiraceae bacterium]|jgi:signal transduction histidine kinase/CheY-like chemotaxis protein/ligand-binding sensor domain-containing protein
MILSSQKIAYKFFLLIFFTCLQVLSAKAQEYIVSLQQLTTNDGLLHREVESIFQDSRGFMWIATAKGLSRYDGYQFKHWTKEDGLTSDKVRIKVEDAEGYLWLFSADGNWEDKISLLHIETEKIVSFKDKFGAKAHDNLPDFNDRFLKSEEGTIYYIDKQRTALTSFHPGQGIQSVALDFSEGLELVCFSSPNAIWAQQARKAISFYQQNNDDQVSEHYKDRVVEIDLNGRTLNQYEHNGYLGTGKFFLKEKALWYQEELPEEMGDFYKIDAARKRWKIPVEKLHLEDEFAEMPGFFLEEYLEKNDIIFGAHTGRLVLMHPDKGVVMDLNEYFPELNMDNRLGYKGHFMDSENRIWIAGDFGCYILDIQENLFQKRLYKDLNAEDEHKKRLACRDIIEYRGELLVATESNNILDLNSGERIIEASNLDLNNLSWSLYHSRDGNLYSGGYPYFFNLNVENQRTELVREAEDKNLGIWSIFEDQNGKIWLGANGLRTISPGEKVIKEFDEYNQFDALKDAIVLDIKEEQDGIIWLSTNAGLFTLDIEKGITERYWSGGEGQFYLPTDNVQHFFQDRDNLFWLATAGDGLIRWDKEKNESRRFTTADGLANNVIYAVYGDDFDHLWMSSDYGIMQFNKTTNTSTAYLTKDGITHDEFNRISHFQDKDGTIYFGGLNGVTSFHPQDFQTSRILEDSPIRITEFLQFNGDDNELIDRTGLLTQSHQITMYPSDRFFQLHFSLLAYENNDQIEYAYKIEGIDKDWNVQKENSLRLSRLPYGKHVLKIKGQASGGEWSSNILEIEMNIVRPFYLQGWFILLAVLSFLGLTYRLYQFNINRKLTSAETQRILDLDQLKTKLYNNISHEFRTPLTVIMGLADNIREQPQEKSLIKRNSKNLLQLVNQLLDLAKLDAQSIHLNYKQADIITYLKYLMESFHSLAIEKYIPLTFDPEEEEIVMDFDELKIQQIIYNLVSNAIKFTPENGRISLLVSRRTEKGQPFIQINIEDTGIGITKKDIAFIYDRFYQTDDSNTQAGGTGIGLSLTKGLIQQMNGNITVESEVSKGTVFTILLPITNQSPLADHLTPAPVNLSLESQATEINNAIDYNKPTPAVSLLNKEDRPRVLIIEDNKDVATYLKLCIQDSYEIEYAENGQVGIEKAFKVIPDLIISDVMMPFKDGYEVTQRLKNDSRTSHIPIILLTAKATTQDKVEGLEVGADAYLLKPFQKEELLVRLRKLIELRTQLHAYYTTLSDQIFPKEKILSLDEILIQKLHKLITDEIGNSNLDAEDLCREGALSKAQLYRKIKALTGKTPALYIRSIRLTKAMELLREGKLSISEVAYSLGFSDPSYFSRIFSKEFEQTPSSVLDK